jgi:hypothetical protein
MRWARHVVRMGELKLKGRKHGEDLDVDGRIIL